jgi:hypothetical protein
MKISFRTIGISVLMLSLALTGYLASVAVRASPPPPLTFAYQNSTFGGPVATLVCSPTNGGDVQVLSQNVPISSGHTAYIFPPIFSGAFNVSSATNPTYTVAFYVNGSAYGSIKGFAPASGVPATTSFQEPMSNIVIYQFFNSGQKGPQTLVFTVEISTASAQSVCVQQWYIDIEIAST